MKKRAILLVSFGTSHADTRARTLDVLAREIKEQFPDWDLYQAWTSKMIIRILNKRDGIHMDTVSEAMEAMNRDGVEELIVQPTHIINGYENDAMKADVLQGMGRIRTVRFGEPLLSEERSRKDGSHKEGSHDRVLEAVLAEVENHKDGDTAVVMMGHGTAHSVNKVYTALNRDLIRLGHRNVFLGTVEAEPSIDVICTRIQKAGYHSVFLLPFLFVAGEHAKRDMAGDGPDSWKNRLEAIGCQVEVRIRGLGSYESVRHIFVDHIREAMERKLCIRKAEEGDIPAVAEIYRRIHREESLGNMTIGWLPGVYPVENTALSALERDDLFVALWDGTVAASAILNQHQEESYRSGGWYYDAQDEEVMVMHTLTVDPEHSGCGIAGAFCEYYEDYARSRDCTVLRIDTQEKNTVARAMYPRFGYKEAGIVPCDFNGIPDIRLVLLEKKLEMKEK